MEYGWKIDHIKISAELTGWAEEEESAKDGWNNEKWMKDTHKSIVQMDEQKENNQPRMDEKDGR